MITLGSTLTPAREAGVVYPKPWMVELVLDLPGTLPEKRLADLEALEPWAGDGAQDWIAMRDEFGQDFDR